MDTDGWRGGPWVRDTVLVVTVDPATWRVTAVRPVTPSADRAQAEAYRAAAARLGVGTPGSSTRPHGVWAVGGPHPSVAVVDVSCLGSARGRVRPHSPYPCGMP